VAAMARLEFPTNTLTSPTIGCTENANCPNINRRPAVMSDRWMCYRCFFQIRLRNRQGFGQRKSNPDFPRLRKRTGMAQGASMRRLEDELRAPTWKASQCAESSIGPLWSATGVAPALRTTLHPPPEMEQISARRILERSMIGGYEIAPRIAVAEAVHTRLQSTSQVVEAGTGTGKTLAYLLPAICSGRRVVIRRPPNRFRSSFTRRMCRPAKAFRA